LEASPVTVGETLAAARVDRGLSVEDVSAQTRIRGGLIRAIESDDFSGCGGAVYARGHIRSLARAVGLDPEPLVADYDRGHSDEVVPSTLAPTLARDTDAAASAERKRPNWAAAMAAALVVICVLAGIGVATGGGGGSSPPTAKNTPADIRTTTSAPKATSPASPPPDAVANTKTNAAVALVRVTSSQTWMSVSTVSGKVLFEGLLLAGQRKEFRDAKGLRLTIGNAPVVHLVANGRDIGTPKSQGNVAHLTIPRGGAVQYA
jgi:cytoskeleton protein RodZ